MNQDELEATMSFILSAIEFNREEKDRYQKQLVYLENERIKLNERQATLMELLRKVYANKK